MSRLLSHIVAIITLLCAISVPQLQAEERHDISSDGSRHECVVRYDAPYTGNVEERTFTSCGSMLRTNSQHRLSTRPTRLLPTHGGKPDKDYFRNCGNNNQFHNLTTFYVFAQALKPWRKVVLSPRSYYVIALRRFLC